jgi:hypothetical protein
VRFPDKYIDYKQQRVRSHEIGALSPHFFLKSPVFVVPIEFILYHLRERSFSEESNMKKYQYSIVLFFALTAVMAAQSLGEKPRSIFVGPMLGITGAVDITDYHISGPKRNPLPGSILGVMSEFRTSPSTGVLAGLGYYTLAFSDQNTAIRWDFTREDASITLPKILTTEGSFHYLNLLLMFKVTAFTIGFNFGLPLSATMTNSGPDTLPYLFNTNKRIAGDISPKTSDMPFLIEGRIGADFTFHEDAFGKLNVGFSLGYTFNQMMNATEGNYPIYSDNFRLPNIMLHLSYLFGVY